MIFINIYRVIGARSFSPFGAWSFCCSGRCLRGNRVSNNIEKLFFFLFSRRAEKASNLTFSKCLHSVDLNIPRILMTHDKMAVTASIRA